MSTDYTQTDGGILVPDKSEYRHDAWQNEMSGMGVPGIDKTLATTYSSFGTCLSQETLRSLYKSDWLTRKICLRPAKDATRKLIQLKDADTHKIVMNKFKEIGLRKKVRSALSWSRLSGGAGIVLITNGDPMEPLSDSEELIDIEVYDRWCLNPISYDMNYKGTNYLKPLAYQTDTGQQFHHTRVCKFSGEELTKYDERENLYWGGSTVVSVWAAIKNLQATYEDVRFILSELNIGILKIPDLTVINTQQGQGGAAQKVQKRVNSFNATKSNQRVAALDKEEDFNFINRTVTGVGELMSQFKNAVSSASDMGELVLFGESPSGLNASQEEQLAVYYDSIEDLRQDQVAPCIDKILYVMGLEGEEWKFESLWEMSDKDKSLVMQQSAAAIMPMVNTLLSPEEAIAQLNSLSVWSIDDSELDAPKIDD